MASLSEILGLQGITNNKAPTSPLARILAAMQANVSANRPLVRQMAGQTAADFLATPEGGLASGFGVGSVGGVAGRIGPAGKATKRVFAFRMTPAEKKFFREVFGSSGDRAELLDEVPSARFSNSGEQLQIDPSDLERLTKYIDDTVVLDRPGNVPPRFNTGKFLDDFIEDFKFE